MLPSLGYSSAEFDKHLREHASKLSGQKAPSPADLARQPNLDAATRIWEADVGFYKELGLRWPPPRSITSFAQSLPIFERLVLSYDMLEFHRRVESEAGKGMSIFGMLRAAFGEESVEDGERDKKDGERDKKRIRTTKIDDDSFWKHICNDEEDRRAAAHFSR